MDVSPAAEGNYGYIITKKVGYLKKKQEQKAG